MEASWNIKHPSTKIRIKAIVFLFFKKAVHIVRPNIRKWQVLSIKKFSTTPNMTSLIKVVKLRLKQNKTISMPYFKSQVGAPELTMGEKRS